MGRVKKEEDLGPEADENWKSKDPKALAYEIATFMGGSWPTRPVRKVQLSLDGVPTDDEELFELTKLNPTLLSEMSTKTRFLFLEVYYDDLQDVYSEVMETLVGDMVRSWRPIPKRAPTGINRPCRHEPRIARRAHGAGGSRPLALAPHVGMTTSALNREAATAHAAAHWLPSGRANSKGCTKTARRQLHSWLRRLGGRGALRL